MTLWTLKQPMKSEGGLAGIAAAWCNAVARAKQLMRDRLLKIASALEQM